MLKTRTFPGAFLIDMIGGDLDVTIGKPPSIAGIKEIVVRQ